MTPSALSWQDLGKEGIGQEVTLPLKTHVQLCKYQHMSAWFPQPLMPACRYAW